MLRLFLLLTLMPALELFLLLQVGAFFGPLPTLLLILFTGLLGAAAARSEGFSVLRQLHEDTQRGIPPATRLAEGALVVAGGLLLVTPGLITDVFGFAMVLGPTRRLLAPAVLRWFVAQIASGNVHVSMHQQHSEGVRFRQGGPSQPNPTTSIPSDPPKPPPFDHPTA